MNVARKYSHKLNIKLIITVICIIAVVLIAIVLFKKNYTPPADSYTPKNIASIPPQETPIKIKIPIESKPVIDYNQIDYNQLETDKDLQETMNQRKAKYGLDESLDLIVKQDESVKVADTTISMQDIKEKAALKQGELIEQDIQKPSNLTNTTEYGIHVVEAGDNIWDIHFKLLREYFANKNIDLSLNADEPLGGQSSGIGKVLKFSEQKVYIYNVLDKKFDIDINTIQPMSKIVIYNMKEVFELLNQINFTRMNNIKFDGETLWISNNDENTF